jgi:hypothetical protein
MTLLRRQRLGSRWGAWTAISRRAGSFDHPTVTMLNGGMAVVAAPLRGPVNVFVTRSNGDSLFAAALGDSAVNQSGNPAVVVGDSLIVVPFTDYEVSYVRRSRDGGKSWEPAARVTDRCSDPFQQLAHATHLYFVCEGDADSLLLFESADSGSTWLPRWTLPDTAAGARGTARGTPSVVALAGEAVAIVWQELSASGCRELRAAFATAGGEVGGEALLSGTPQCGRADTLSFLGRRFPFGGDYVGVASLRSTFYVLWPAPSGSGGFQLEFVRVKTAGR